jgi:hypothetical protein
MRRLGHLVWQTTQRLFGFGEVPSRTAGQSADSLELHTVEHGHLIDGTERKTGKSEVR